MRSLGFLSSDHFHQGVVFAHHAQRLGVANSGHGFNGYKVFFHAKATARKNFLITAGVKIGKALAKFNLIAIKRNRSLSTLAFKPLLCRHIVNVNG